MTEKRAYAKINLFLDIESRRTDGYHNIKSIMQTVDWYDVIKVEKTQSDGIRITSDDKSIPIDSSNIVYRVAKSFLCELDCHDGIAIDIQKNIPISAGMAGGSADGAATLEALNELFDYPFSVEELIELGKNIGADIPFCLVGGTKITSGIGEIIEPCADMPECFIVCAKQGNNGVATPQAYKELDNKYDGFWNYKYNKLKLDTIITAIERKDIKEICKNTFNIFEEVIAKEHVSVNKLKKIMKSGGALSSMMSGSGPSVFGIFTDFKKAEKTLDSLLKCGAKARICKPISK